MNFERIKPDHKLSKLDAVDFEKKKRQKRKDDINKHNVRKQKRVEVEE